MPNDTIGRDGLGGAGGIGGGISAAGSYATGGGT